MRGSPSYIPINNDAARQYIDARQAFLALRDAQRDARQVRGGICWHGRSDSLIRTSTYGSEKSLGTRSLDTEKIYADFMARKAELTQRVDDLKTQLRRHERVNNALYVGRVDPTVMALLTRLETAELAEYFHVVGTHALYAYETVAGVRLDANVTATRDIDLLWDVRKRMSFWTQMERLDSSFLALLKKVDSSFRIRQSQGYTAVTAVNAEGFEVAIFFATGDIECQPILAHKTVREAHVAAEVIAGEQQGNKELAAAAFNARGEGVTKLLFDDSPTAHGHG